jgi:GntR family transcriptional regulator
MGSRRALAADSLILETSRRIVAEHYGVAFHTIRNAMKVLRDRGLIISVHGRGTFVREDLP